MIFFHQRLNNYKRSKLQYTNNNFKTSLVIAPHPRGSYDPLRAKTDMWFTPKLISGCTTNFNFCANCEDKENDQDNENHPENKNEVNYPANKYMFKVNNRKKSWRLYG